MINDPEIRALVSHQAIGTPLDFLQSLLFRFQASSETTAGRLRAAEFLKQLIPSIIVILRSLAISGEAKAYEEALRKWRRARRGLSDAPIENLQFYARHAEGTRKKHLEKEIAALEPIEDAREKMELKRGSGVVQLGGWLAQQIKASPELSEQYLPYLSPLPSEVDTELLLKVLEDYFARHAFELLAEWHSEEMIEAGASSWSGDRSESGLYWAALLLLMKVPPETSIHVVPTPWVSWAAQVMRTQWAAVIEDAGLWQAFLPDEDLTARRTNLESAWTAAVKAQAAIERRQVADADLDPLIVDAFRTGNRESFAQTQKLSPALDRVGRRHRIQSSSTFKEHGRFIRELLPKKWFVGDAAVGGLNEDLGAEMARDQDDVLYSKLREAVHGSAQPAGNRLRSLTQSIEALTGANRMALVIGRDHYRLRDLLFEAEMFTVDPETEGAAIGHLAGAPVYLIGHDERSPLLVIDPRHVQLTEYLDDGESSPLRIDISTLDAERAKSTVSRSFKFADQPELDPEEVIQRLVDERVTVEVRASFELQAGTKGVTAFDWHSRATVDEA